MSTILPRDDFADDGRRDAPSRDSLDADARGATAALAIEARALSRVYHPGTAAEVVALRDVDLRIARGEFVAIMGPSGSGKSTLMNILGCLDTPSAGQYLCDGIDVATLDAEERAHLRLTRIGFIFQGFNLLSRMTAVENVMMPMGYAGVPVSERRPRAMEALAAVGLADRAKHKPAELSGGQQQRVAIARALINTPAILLADEPTGALDSHTGEEIMRLFHRLREEGHTVILITHDAAVAANAARRCDMRDGELHEVGVGVQSRSADERLGGIDNKASTQ